MTTPILSVYCDERRDPKVRHVYPLVLTEDNLRRFWDAAKQFRVLFNREHFDDFDTFLSMFIGQYEDKVIGKGLFWVVDDFVGLYYLMDISDVEATVHYSFFDRCLNGRVNLTKHMLQYLFDTYKFRRLTAEIPTYVSQHPHHFARILGFRYEGRKKCSAPFDGKWWDSDVYGLLPEHLHIVEGKKYHIKDTEAPPNTVLCPNCVKYFQPKED